MRKSKMLAGLAMCGAVAMTSGVGAASAATGTGSPASSTLLTKVASSHQLVIGTSNDAPWSYVTTSGQAEGIIPDMLREFLQYEHIKAQIKSVPMPFASLIPSIQSGRIQLIGDAMYKTAPRQKIIDFTRVIFYNPEALVVQKGNPLHIAKLTDLVGKTGGSYEGATYVDTLKSVKSASGGTINVKVYPNVNNVIGDVSNGRLAGGLIDSSIAAYAIKQNPSLNIQLATGYVPPNKAADDNALGIAKGDPAFTADFNAWYAMALKDGDIKKLFTKWGLTPSTYWLSL